MSDETGSARARGVGRPPAQQWSGRERIMRYHDSVSGEWRPDTVIGLSDVAQLLGVELPTAEAWLKRDILPDADFTPSDAPVWWLSRIRAWAVATGRLDPETDQPIRRPS